MKKNQPRTRTKTKKVLVCPECSSPNIVPVVHGIPTAAWQKALKEGNAVLATREEWEGLTEWYCKHCGCDWGGAWRRFRRSGNVRSRR